MDDDKTVNAIAVLGSVFFPGAGQFVKGHFIRGILLFIAYIICLVLTIALIGFILAPIVWLIAIIDAYKLPVKGNVLTNNSAPENLESLPVGAVIIVPYYLINILANFLLVIFGYIFSIVPILIELAIIVGIFKKKKFVPTLTMFDSILIIVWNILLMTGLLVLPFLLNGIKSSLPISNFQFGETVNGFLTNGVPIILLFLGVSTIWNVVLIWYFNSRNRFFNK